MSKALTLFAVHPAGTLADNAPLMLYTRLSEMLFFSTHIHDVQNVAELHSMRIAAKRLRYTLEIFSPAYEAPLYKDLLDKVKTCQEKIGEIHDCDVRIVQIKEFLNQNIVKKPEIRSGLQNLIDREITTRQSLYDDFVGYWSTLAEDRLFEKQFVETIFAARLTSETTPASPPNRATRQHAASSKKP